MRFFFTALSFFLVLVLAGAGVALAERTAASPVTGETVDLFGVTYTIDGIVTTSTAFQGTGALTIDCGMSLGFREGATPALDQILFADECGAGGEDVQILTGVDPTTFAPTAAASTAAYIIDNSGGGYDPAAIEWINDNNAGAGTDQNYRLSFNWSSGSYWHLAALDADGIPYPDYSTLSDDDDAADHYVGMGACKNAKDDTATRYYWGGVDQDSGAHFAYMAFDLTSNSFVNANSVLLDGIGTPDDTSTAVAYERSLKAMGFDGTYYYVMVKQPGAAEAWIYRYNSFPDPSPSGDTVHPEATPLGAQIDNAAGGVAWGTTSNVTQTGMCFGRTVNGNRVLYILCDEYLYTLVPQPVADVQDWKLY